MDGIGPGLIGVGVHLHHQPVEGHLPCGVAQGAHQLAATADVTGVAKQWHSGGFASQLHHQFPQGGVAVALVMIHREAAVHGCDVVDAGGMHAFYGPQPQAHVGAHGVLHHHLHVAVAQGGAQFAHHEWIGGGACPYPHRADAVLLAQLHLLGTRHLAAVAHAQFSLQLAHPLQRGLAQPLETAGACARLPHSATYQLHLLDVAELHAHLAQLLAALHAAGACHDVGVFFFGHKHFAKIHIIFNMNRKKDLTISTELPFRLNPHHLQPRFFLLFCLNETIHE